MPDVRRKVVLVCDTMNEIDDQFAIAYALGSKAVEVLGVISSQNTLVHGHESVHLYREEARRVAQFCGREDLPMLIGAPAPMEHIRAPINSEGVDFLAKLADAKVTYSILGTGPATDLAAFRLIHPVLSQDVPVIWAGSFPDERTWKEHKYGELNARADIAAWRVLYANPFNFVCLPGWPGVAKVAVEVGPFVLALRSKGIKVADYLANILEDWCIGKKSLDMDAKRNTKVLWDIVNVAYYSVPNAVILKKLAIPEVDASGSMYWDRLAGEVEFCVDVDSDAIFEDFWHAIENINVMSR